MALIGRKTLRSTRARINRIDTIFKRLAQTLIILCGLFILVTWLSYRPSLQINSVTVSGVRSIPLDKVEMIIDDAFAEKFFLYIFRNNEILLPRLKISGNIRSSFSRAKNVTLSFTTHRHLNVTIEEYKPTSLYCPIEDTPLVYTENASSTEGATSPLTCYFVDQDGYVFSGAPEYSGFPFLTFFASTTSSDSGEESYIGRPMMSSEKYKATQEFLNKLRDIGLRPDSITILPESDIRIHTDEPWTILWSTSNDTDEGIKNLTIVRASLENGVGGGDTASEIDLRFGNKVFYK